MIAAVDVDWRAMVGSKSCRAVGNTSVYHRFRRTIGCGRALGGIELSLPAAHGVINGSIYPTMTFYVKKQQEEIL